MERRKIKSEIKKEILKKMISTEDKEDPTYKQIPKEEIQSNGRDQILEMDI